MGLILWKLCVCVVSMLHGCSLNTMLAFRLACCCVLGTCLWRGRPFEDRHYIDHLWHRKTCVSLFQWDFDCFIGQSLSGPMLAALSRCRPASRWTLSLPGCSAFSLSCSTVSSQRIAATRLHVLRTQTALFHQSEAKAGPDPHKATSGKNTCMTWDTVSGPALCLVLGELLQIWTKERIETLITIKLHQVASMKEFCDVQVV